MTRIMRIGGNRRKQRGQSIVEMSLMMPLLLVALYIPADFGIAFFVGSLAQTSARDGARVGSGLQKTGGAAPDYTFSSAEANTVRKYVLGQMPAYLTNKKVGIKYYSGASCMEFIEVTAEGQYKFGLYRLIKLVGGTAPDFMLISRTTQMRHNYQPAGNHNPCPNASAL